VRGERGIKVHPTSKILAKLVNKNAIKHQKRCTLLKNVDNPYIPSLSKFGKNLMDPLPGFSNRVHLCFYITVETLNVITFNVASHLL
jgi:hypothetical protein